MTAPGKPLDLDGMEAVARAAPHKRGWCVFGSAQQKILSIFTEKGDPDLIHWSGFDQSVAATSWPERERLATYIATFDPPAVLALIQTQRELVGALKLAERLVDEALPKFDWGRSSLDANAIGLLNDAPRAIRAALKALGEQPL